MAVIIQGKKQDPVRVDVQQADGQWVMGVDLVALTTEVAIKSIRRTINFQKGHIYVYRTEFIDRATGTTKEIVSRATRFDADTEANQQNTVGLVDSPLSVELWDIT